MGTGAIPNEPVDTGKVADRRQLKFNSLAEVRRELEEIAAAHRSESLRAAGNWSPTQVLNHVAAWMEYAMDGYPAAVANPPWMVRTMLRFKKRRFLHEPMPAGVWIPGLPLGTVGQEDGMFEEAAARLRQAIERLDSMAPARGHPIFGRLSHDEWRAINLRHCELHLGFLQPRPKEKG